MQRNPQATPVAVREAAPAYAANTDAAFWDLFAAAGELLRLYGMPAYQIETLMDAIEAQPLPVDQLRVCELIALVRGAQA